MENKERVRVALNDAELEGVSGGDNVPTDGEIRVCDWCGQNIWCARKYNVEVHKSSDCPKRHEHGIN